ncbi:hypothetical protein [Rosistilla oblonga]|uniref:hypothetical protein n=1 Tax=Rosistilla oblonga TaxID=2527990 RepID=UPI003A97BE65
MKIYYWNVVPNFGDLINPWLWPKVLPGLTAGGCPKTNNGILESPGELLVGIGTLINQHFPKAKRSIVVGTGVGYGKLPIFGDNVKVYCVRGPRSAHALGLPRSQGIIDPGILVKEYCSGSDEKHCEFSFMPQVSSVRNCRGAWEKVCKKLGLGYIDPRSPVDDTVMRISHSGTLITESMHGAIVAEALRVPWIPVVSRSEILSFKWHDWCESIGVEYRPVQLWTLNDPENPSFRQKMKTAATFPLAMSQLRGALKRTPTLGSEAIIDDKVAQLKSVLDVIQRDENGAR